jgi:glycosyltransferase involved in cell wall biosynthesis
MGMIIGIDASRALKPHRTGTEVHNAEIIKHLVKIDSKNTYRLYANREPEGDMLNLGPNVEWRIMPFPRGWTLFRLSWEMLIKPPDVLFIPAHILPIIAPKRSVVMIHDIGFDHFPELYKWTDKLYHRYAVRFAKLFASHILTPTEFTRQDLHQRHKIPLHRMTAVHHGFDSQQFHPIQGNESSPVKEPYFYFVGRLEYKKNISRMLKAFAIFKERTGLPHKFILAGRPSYGYTEIEKTLGDLSSLKNDITFLGYTKQEEATRYLRHAEALVFPTLFEGFGLPVLEAFASGTPVITSNTTSLPEIAGEAALLVDPTKVETIADAMQKLAENPELRNRLREKGHKRYKNFSWEKAAHETLAVLEKVGSRAS